ncbi:MAG: sirohydrochlorin chelatase [Chloroflexi bacterium]|nr:sirohydrochlorin chelatase [Chloroflexota bacterium]
MTKHVVLVVGHGTRSAEGLAQFETFVGALAERLQRPAKHCYLELAEPDMATGLSDAASAAGAAGEVIVLPLFLGPGDHYKRDVPEAVRACRSALGKTSPVFRYAAPLGPHPKLIELLNVRIGEALTTTPDALPRKRTALLVVGRGSLEEDGNSAVTRTAFLLGDGQPWLCVEYAFQAVRHPTVPEAIQRCRRLGAQQVVVAPYLLFGGRVYDDVCATSRRTATAAGLRVIHASHLGSQAPIHPLLLDVAEQRCREAGEITS